MISSERSCTSYPLSAAQQEVWMDIQLRGDDTVWNIAECVTIEGVVAWSQLRNAIEIVVSRTTALRLIFDLSAPSPAQTITTEVSADFQFVSFKAEVDPPTAAADWMREACGRPFSTDLPRARFALLEIAADHFYFLACYSHLVVDGYGMSQIAHAVAATYTQLVAGDPITLQSDELEYRRYLDDDAAFQGSESYIQERHFWSSQYATPVPLATPSHREPSTEFGGNERELAVWDAGSTRQLEAIATRNGIHLPHCLGALAAIYLCRLTGAGDIPIGFAVHGRQRRFTRLVAMCANVVPARLSVDLEMPLDGAIVSLASQLASAAANGRYRGLHSNSRVRLRKIPPFSLLVNVIRLRYDLRFGSARSIVSRYLHTGPVEDLTFIYRDRNHATPGNADLTAFGNRSLYAPTDLQRHLSAMRTLVMQGHDQGASPISELTLQAPTDEPRRLHSLTGVVAPPASGLLHEVVQAQCASAPHDIALHEGEARISYAELDARVERVAAALIAAGIQPESVIGVHLPRCSELIVAMLGIFKAGGVYLPLDPRHPAARNVTVLHNAGARQLLFSSNRAGPLPGYSGSRLDLGEILESAPATAVRHIRWRSLAQQLSYIITTSGSSGTPKAVMISHAAALNHMRWLQTVCPLRCDDRVAFKTTVCFDASFNELLWPLVTGAQIVIVPDDGPLDSTSLVELIDQRSITVLQLVPSLLERLLEEPLLGRCTSLRLIISAGEALTGTTAGRVLRCLPTVRLLNLYGPTEAAIDAASFECQPDQAHARVPIGRPITNTRLYVLDSAFQLVPPGVVGDLWIAGSGLARGYLRAPGLTADSFRANSFGFGERMYRTGDRGRYRPDGIIDYLGRADAQVKIRGFRIELGEIETALRANADLQEATVLAIEYAPSDTRVVAFIVPRSGTAMDVAALRAALARVLPEYMVPVSFCVLAALPRLSNGKIDGARLKERSSLSDSPATTAEAPAVGTPLEQSLQQMWSAVLHLPQLGLHDSLFDCGGSSLHAMMIVRQISERFGVRVPIRELFDRPSIAEFCEVLRSRLAT